MWLIGQFFIIIGNWAIEQSKYRKWFVKYISASVRVRRGVFFGLDTHKNTENSRLSSIP